MRRSTIQERFASRARMILLCAEGRSNREVAQFVGKAPATVGIWRKRFAEERLGGLSDLDRPGGPRKISDGLVEELVVRTLETTPKGDALEHAHGGEGVQHESKLCRPRLACPWLEASFDRDIPTLHGSALHRQSP